jgi:Phosphate transporter family
VEGAAFQLQPCAGRAALAISPVIGFGGAWLMERGALRGLRRATVHMNWPVLRAQWVTSGWLGLSHGANGAQKAVGVLAVLLLTNGSTTSLSAPVWATLACAAALAMGTALGGWRIVKTIGRRIFRIRPLDGLVSQTSSAAVIVAASVVSAPASTTQVVSSSSSGWGGPPPLPPAGAVPALLPDQRDPDRGGRPRLVRHRKGGVIGRSRRSRAVRPLTPGPAERRLGVRRKEAIQQCLLDDSAPANADAATTDTHPDPGKTSTAGYRLGRIVVLLSLAAACALAALGAVTAPDRPDDLAGTVKVVRYAEPTATGRNVTRWAPATDATITVQVTEVG